MTTFLTWSCIAFRNKINCVCCGQKKIPTLQYIMVCEMIITKLRFWKGLLATSITSFFSVQCGLCSVDWIFSNQLQSVFQLFLDLVLVSQHHWSFR